MYEGSTLEYIVYGSLEGELRVLGSSDGLAPQVAEDWHRRTSLQPIKAETARGSQSMGIFHLDDEHLLLSQAVYRRGDPTQPVYRHLRLPRTTFQMMNGDVQAIAEAITFSFPVDPVNQPLDAIYLAPPPTMTADRRIGLFEKFMTRFGDLDALVTLLSAALDENQLIIRGYEEDLNERLELVQALLLMLPSAARPLLTFSTHVERLDDAQARVIFSDNRGHTQRHIYDVDEAQLPDQSDFTESPYIRYLKAVHQQGIRAFASTLRSAEVEASEVMADHPVEAGLTALAERYFESQREITVDTDTSTEALIDLLNDEGAHLSDATLIQYTTRLLKKAVDERDTQAARVVIQYMDENPTVHHALIPLLEQSLEVEPDAVYFLARTRLAQEITSDWIPLLHAAATVALQVAVMDGDNETIISWLNLIAREPAGYQLQEILTEGIITAQSRAHEDGELGAKLLIFVARRANQFIDDLLSDSLFIAQLDAPLGPAFREYDPDAVAEVFRQGREITLILLSQAAKAAPTNEAAAAVFTPEIVEVIWEFYQKGPFANLPDDFQPAAIIDQLTDQENTWLGEDSFVVFTMFVLVSGNNHLLHKIDKQLRSRGQVTSVLQAALEESGLPAAELVETIRRLNDEDVVTSQQAADLHLRLIAYRGWEQDQMPMVEQVARLLQQDPSITLSADMLWRMLRLAADNQTELVARVVTRRLVVYAAGYDDENALIDTLKRLQDQLRWSNSTRTYVMNWWRGFMIDQPLSRLQQIDRTLEGRKSLDEARSIVRTTIGIRKIFGKRSLEDFAAAVGTSFSILQAFSDSFDPQGKQSGIRFDQSTVRAEIEAQMRELTPDLRKVLAKNLKELAQLIISMAEHRSKANLIRREEDIERQLLSGEQQPQSAIDTLKWLSGYLDGLQDNTAEDA